MVSSRSSRPRIKFSARATKVNGTGSERALSAPARHALDSVVEFVDALAAPILDRTSNNAHFGGVTQDRGGVLGIIGIPVFQVGIDRQVGGLRDDAAILQELGAAHGARRCHRDGRFEVVRFVDDSPLERTTYNGETLMRPSGCKSGSIPTPSALSRSHARFTEGPDAPLCGS